MRYFAILTILLLNSLRMQAATVDTVVIHSASMNKDISNVVIFPDAYTREPASFPVVYLLHGAGDDHTKWLKKAPLLKDYADLYEMIIVCPNGEKTSWYFDSPVDDNMKYETYISEELVTFIDSHYKTLASKQKRAIIGHSMGGHGAFYLAFRHQDIWGAAASMSGGLDLRPFPEGWDIAKRLGSYSENKEIWDKNTVTNMLHLVSGKDLRLAFDCGVDDFFFEGNKKLHQKMRMWKIPHDYTERAGDHTWPYWINSVKYHLLYFSEFFKES